MRAVLTYLLIALLTLPLAVGCSRPSNPEPSGFLTLDKGYYSGIEESMTTVVTDPVAFAALWARHGAVQTPTPPMPQVDFDQYSVLAVFVGERNTGGYGVEVLTVRTAEGKVTATIARKVPGDGAGTGVTTQPYHIVRIPKVDAQAVLEVVWR